MVFAWLFRDRGSVCSVFFFFSSRRRHTRYWRDWSSDVCSSDLTPQVGCRTSKGNPARGGQVVVVSEKKRHLATETVEAQPPSKKPLEGENAETMLKEAVERSEERRVGKECRCRWSEYDKKKKER